MANRRPINFDEPWVFIGVLRMNPNILGLQSGSCVRRSHRRKPIPGFGKWVVVGTTAEKGAPPLIARVLDGFGMVL